MKTICLHGAESTGKTVLAGRLGYPWVSEYGRAYCEERGTDLTMPDLLAIAEGQAAENRKACGKGIADEARRRGHGETWG